MNYRLSTKGASQKREPLSVALRRLLPLIAAERAKIIFAFSAIVITSAVTLTSPYIIGQTVDRYIVRGDFSGVVLNGAILVALYFVALVTSYLQIRTMGGVGRRILFNLRNALFTKLQQLPVAFFNQNRAGDLISRINNDTDKLNQFFAQALMQFLSNGVLIVGSGILLLLLNIRLGGAGLVPALLVLVITRSISGWVQRANFASLQTLGGLSGEVQESLANFKVVVAFNRLDYFRTKFNGANAVNYAASIRAGVANNVFVPLYGLAYNIAQLAVLTFGIWMITRGELTTGLLIGYLLYVNNFYNPLRQIATAWSSLQMALAALDRISEVLALNSDMRQLPPVPAVANAPLLEFAGVSFSYAEGKDVLADVSFTLERGRTYALVGPTGGGKTTTASLMARLYDPNVGIVRLNGRDIRTVPPAERAQKIGFILQEPFLFTGTVRDNILYGNDELKDAQRRGAHPPARGCRAVDAARPLRTPAGYPAPVVRRFDQPRPEAADRFHPHGVAQPRAPDPRRGNRQHRHRHRAAAGRYPAQAAGEHDTGDHRSPPEYHRQRRRDILRQRRRGHPRRLDGARRRHAAARRHDQLRPPLAVRSTPLLVQPGMGGHSGPLRKRPVRE